MEKWRGWEGSWYLAVSEYLRFSPAEESGRYLIVIASMERTEAVPVRKFLIYLVFLFSLFHSLSLPHPLVESWRCRWGVFRHLWYKRKWAQWVKAGKRLFFHLVSLVFLINRAAAAYSTQATRSLTWAHPSAQSSTPTCPKWKIRHFPSNVQPNIIYTLFRKIETYLGRLDSPYVFKFHSSMNFIFPDFGQNYKPIDLLSAHCLHIFSAAVSVFALSRRSIFWPFSARPGTD